MAKFVKGDWVRVTPTPDLFWKYWTDKHSAYCNKIAEVLRVENSKNHPNVLFLSLEHPNAGNSVWFQDKHCVAEENYNKVFEANMQRAVDKLNEYEAIARRCRDDILRHVFTPEDQLEPDEEFWCDDDELYDEFDAEEIDEFQEDWEDVVTKPMVPLPGKKTIIRKTKGSKVIKKALNNAKKKLANAKLDIDSIDPTDFMTEEELYDYLSEIGGDDKLPVWGDPD